MEGRARWAPWFLSLLLHAAVVIGSLFVVWTILPAATPPESPVVIDFEAPAPARSARTESSSATAQPPAPRAEAPPPPRAAVPVPRPAPLATEPPAPPPPPRYETTFVAAGASNAREVVFVVDASGSAISSFPYIAAQLRRSVAALHPSQRFQIILMKDSPDGRRGFDFLRLHPAENEPIPIDALPENVARAIEWIGTVNPGGPSAVAESFLGAVGVHPDAVFILARLSAADRLGTTPAQLLGQLDALNPADPRTGHRHTTIKAMQMIAPDPTGLLSSIAEAHGGPGGYALVTLADLKAVPARRDTP